MAALLGLWSHMLAAALYGALALVQLRRWNGDPLSRPLITAFAVMAVWAIFAGLLGPYGGLTQFAESGRNLAFLAFMYGLMPAGGEEEESRGGIKAVYAAVAAVIGLQIVVGGVMPGFRATPTAFAALTATAQVLGLTIASGSLILVHNLYGQAAPASRGQLRYPMLALAAMWAFDLHLYTVAYFMHGGADGLFALRGLVLALLTPLFALGLRDNPRWKVQLSRAATFQSVSVIAILFYLIVMMSAARALEIVGGDWARAAQIGLVAAMTLAALVLLPSARARGWLRVLLAKHVFEHRYDYREEWLRFTDTVGRQSEDGATLEERVVKALADIAGAPGGVVLLTEGRRLTPGPRWNSSIRLAPTSDADGADLIRYIESDAYVIDFGAARRRETDPPIPAWLDEAGAWAGVPLIHAGQLVGLVLLEHPPFRRALDWEDFDLFRTAGIQAASYIAEARSQQALADSRRFDEFSRRFAFIMHDIKNLVSQLSLVARNAERHADNPEFRADMIATLQASVRKMNDLLARLSPGAGREGDPPCEVRVMAVIETVAASKRRGHAIRIEGDARLTAMAGPAGLEQALSHLVQNAIDASDTADAITVRAFESGGDIAIEVIDRGRGMSPDFVAHRLFQPFASTKETGFGIGAYEARELIRAMGGRIEVESVAGEGTCFTLILPGVAALPQPHYERMRA